MVQCQRMGGSLDKVLKRIILPRDIHSDPANNLPGGASVSASNWSVLGDKAIEYFKADTRKKRMVDALCDVAFPHLPPVGVMATGLNQSLKLAHFTANSILKTLHFFSADSRLLYSLDELRAMGFSSEAIDFLEAEHGVQKSFRNLSKRTHARNKHNLNWRSVMFTSDYDIAMHKLPHGSEILLRGVVHKYHWTQRYSEYYKGSLLPATISFESPVTFRPGWYTHTWFSDMRQFDNQAGEHDFVNVLRLLLSHRADMQIIELDTRVCPTEMCKYYIFDPWAMNRHNTKGLGLVAKYVDTLNEGGKFAKSELVHRLCDTLLDCNHSLVRAVYMHNGHVFTQLHTVLPHDDGSITYPNVLTGHEYGDNYFTDAMFANRAHMIDTLAGQGKWPTELIVDYHGAGHTLSRAFYLHFPRIAWQTILQNLPYLVLHYVKSTQEYMHELEHIDWVKVLNAIATVLMFSVKDRKPGKLKRVNLFEEMGADVGGLARSLQAEFERD